MDEPPREDGKLSAGLEYVSAFNPALQQNGLPLVTELKFTNETGRDLRGIQ